MDSPSGGAHDASAAPDAADLGDPEADPELPSGVLAAGAAGPVSTPAAAGVDGRAITSELLRLSFPVLLSVALAQIGAVVDRMMVGNLEGDAGGAVALAAVGYVHQLFHLLQTALLAVGLACVAIMARAIGAGRPSVARQALATSIQIALLTTFVLAGAMLAGGRAILDWLGSEPAVMAAALPYLRYVIGSTLLMAVAMAIENGLRANKDTRTPMAIAFAVTVVKLFGNWVLIYGNLGAPAMGLDGAGLATLLGQVVAVVLFGAVVLRAEPGSPLALGLSDWRFARRLWSDIARIALPGIVERIALNFALLLYFRILSQNYGTVAVAVYAVGVPLLSFTWIPGQAYGQAVASMVGQALGAKRPAEAVRAGWTSLALALGTAVVLGIPFAFARRPLAQFFTSDPAVIEGLDFFLISLALAQPFLQAHFALAGAHRGAGDTWMPMVASFVSNWGIRVPFVLLFADGLGWSIEWAWIAIIIDHAVRAAWLTLTFRRGRWLQVRTSADV